MPTFRRSAGWTLVGLSLALHLVTVFAFSRQPDRFAAFTVLPIWVWGGLGLAASVIAYFFLRASLSLIMTAVWAVTLLIGADEARVLAHFGKQAPQPGEPAEYRGEKVIRVITLNCAGLRFGDPAQDIAAWQPDIVLLQDIHPHQVRHFADVLYDGQGDYRAHVSRDGGIGVVTRGRILREVRNPALRAQQLTVEMPDKRQIEIINVHLETAATDLRFWRRQAWRTHRMNRTVRHNEIATVLQVLEQTSPGFPNIPVIFGGDFNAPATDPVHGRMTRDFTDAFAAAGSGWGNTFQRRFPILRIDHIYATRHFTPARCAVAVTRHSDHRMVVADLVLP